MSKETLLKREFTEREVQRMRNIVTKKTGDRTTIQAGWESQIKRQEGDVWDENGKTCIMRPKPDWSSHACDSMRYLAVGYQPFNENWDKPIRRNMKGIV